MVQQVSPYHSDAFSTTDDDSGCGLSRRPSTTGSTNDSNLQINGANGNGIMHKISSTSSLDSVDQDPYLSDTALSEDLDKLSICLTEVSDEKEVKKGGLISDLLQSQLAFWTLVFSFLYSYAWLQHRKKFLMSIFIVIPMVLIVCFTIAWLLGAIVVMNRIFRTSIKIEQMLKFKPCNEEEVERRRRSLSNASRRSSVSCSGRSSSCEEFPKPVCRKHSSSTNSLNQIHVLTNGYGNRSGAASPISGLRTPTSPAYRKMSYAFSHQSADDDFET